MNGSFKACNLTAFAKGHMAEKRSLIFLQEKGFSLIAQRFKTPYGEIDLVMEQTQTLVFVEVKYRENIEHALHAITERQQKRLWETAHMFLAKNTHFVKHTLRFDGIFLSDHAILHIPHILSHMS